MIFSLVLLAAALLDAGNLLNVIALGSGHIRPSVLIIVMVFCCLNARRQDAIRSAFAVGFAADLVSVAIGPHMIVYGILGALLNGMSRVVSMKRIVHQAIVVFLAALLTEFPVAWLENWKTGQAGYRHVSTVFGVALYTAIVAPAVWAILSGIWKKLYPQTEGRSRFR
jgi:rod shape-determining protein MreD